MTDPATPSIPSHPGQAPAGWYPHPDTGEQRWWTGGEWTDQVQPAAAPSGGALPDAAGTVPPIPPAYASPPAFSQPGPTVLTGGASNGYSTAALVLGIVGFVLMGIPFGIGLVLGGIPDILAVIFGIVALNSPLGRAGIGRTPAVVGLVLGAVSLLSVFIGAGWLW